MCCSREIARYVNEASKRETTRKSWALVGICRALRTHFEAYSPLLAYNNEPSWRRCRMIIGTFVLFGSNVAPHCSIIMMTDLKLTVRANLLHQSLLLGCASTSTIKLNCFFGETWFRQNRRPMGPGEVWH